MDVWEEDIKESTGARDFCIEIGKGKKERKRQENINDLLKDFQNLKVSGLLPDPIPGQEGITVKETTEWTVVVYP